MLSKIIASFGLLKKRLQQRWHYYEAVEVTDLPSKLEQNKMYLLGKRGEPFQVAYKCPYADCRQIIYVDVHASLDPRWRLRIHRWWKKGTISLDPSIRGMQSFCKYQCHYWIRRGRFVRCRDFLVANATRVD